MRRKRGMLLPKIGLALAGVGLVLLFGKSCLGATSFIQVLSLWLIGVGVVFISLKLIAQFLFRYVPRLRKAVKAALMLEVRFDPPQPVPGQACKASLKLMPRREKRLERVMVTLRLDEESLDANQRPVTVTLASSSASLEQNVLMVAGQVTSMECSVLVPAADTSSVPPQQRKYQWRATVEVKTNARTPFTATFPISAKS